MRTIVLISSDEKLASRIRQPLVKGECVVRVRPGTCNAPSGMVGAMLFVMDCRGSNRGNVEQAILSLRSTLGRPIRCVALMDTDLSRVLEVIGQDGIRDLDVVLADHEDSGVLIRAILNDHDGTAGTAIASAALRKCVGRVAGDIANAALSSGCRVSSVGRLEGAFHTNRSDLGRQLEAEGSPSPKAVLRIARATYAAVLLRRTNLTLGRIAERVGYSASRWVQELLESEFDARAEDLKSRDPDTPIEEFLDNLLLRWKTTRVGAVGTDAGRQANRW